MKSQHLILLGSFAGIGIALAVGLAISIGPAPQGMATSPPTPASAPAPPPTVSATAPVAPSTAEAAAIPPLVPVIAQAPPVAVAPRVEPLPPATERSAPDRTTRVSPTRAAPADNAGLNPLRGADEARGDLPAVTVAPQSTVSIAATSPPNPAVAVEIRKSEPPPATPPLTLGSPPAVVIRPHEPIANQVSDIDPQRLQKAMELLQQHLAGAKAAPAEVVPAPTAQPVPAGPPPSATPPSASAAPAAADAPAPKAERPAPVTQITRSNKSGEDRFSIHAQNDDVREVLEALSEQGGLSILFTKAVQGKVSATLRNVDVNTALDAILKSAGLVSRREGTFVYVGTPDEFDTLEQALDRLGTRVYRPNYITAAELQTLIHPILTEKLGVVSVSTPAEAGLVADATSAGGNKFAGGDVVVVRDYEAVLTQVDQIVAEIDVRPMQVAIEAMILSVKLDDQNTFGVDFQLLRDNSNVRLGWGTPANSLANFKFDQGGLKFGFLDSSLAAFVNALETVGDTNVIASPRLMVLNKHKADILIGEQLGYVSTTVTETSSTQSVQFLDVGAQLRIRPFISTDGLIRMEVHPELSTGSVKTDSGFTLPNKEVTQVTTNIMVRDGSTVVIGGLMREDLTKNIKQVPYLGSMPVIGPAFRTTDERTQRREIIVLITPHIVYEPETSAEGSDAAGEFHRRQGVYREKMNILSRPALARRYVRLAQNAYASGNRDAALRFAEFAVHFDPASRMAIDLRSTIWQGLPVGDHTLQQPAAGESAVPAEAPPVADWMLEELKQGPVAAGPPPHPADRGVPGRNLDITKPLKLQ